MINIRERERERETKRIVKIIMSLGIAVNMSNGFLASVILVPFRTLIRSAETPIVFFSYKAVKLIPNTPTKKCQARERKTWKKSLCWAE